MNTPLECKGESMKNIASSNSLLKNMLILFYPHKRKLLLILLTIIIYGATNFFGPIIKSFLLDRGIISQEWYIIITCLIIIFTIWVVESIVNYVQFAMCYKIKSLVEFKLFSNGFSKIMRIDMFYYKKNGIYSEIENLKMDVSVIATLVDRNIIQLISCVFGILGSIIGLFVVNWKMALIALSIIPLKTIQIKYAAQKQEKIFKELMNVNEEWNNWQNDFVINSALVKLWNLYGLMKKQIILLKRSIILNTFNSIKINEIQEIISSGIDIFLYIIIFLIGTILINLNEMTIGGLFSFIAYTGALTAPISLISYVRCEFAKINPALDRYIKLLSIKEENKKKISRSSIKLPDQIKFNNITFGTDKITILKDVSFTVNKGEKIAIWGKNGSGKSTLIDIFTRIINSTSGQILFDDTDIKNFHIDDYRNLISIVPQSPSFFNKSIIENINLSKSEKKNIHNLIDEYIPQLNTNKIMGVNGANLSGGERQKVALLRAINKNASIIILDEAASNFDKFSLYDYNQMINDYLLNFPYVFVITHQEKTLSYMDKIVVLFEGRVKEILTYTEYIKKHESREEN